MRATIGELTAETGALQRASQRLTENYRRDAAPEALRSREERLAYLAVRLPATYGAVYSAISEAAVRLPGWAPVSMLDLGAGPGTAIWAAAEIMPSLETFVAVERDPAFAELGRKLAEKSSWTGRVTWNACDLRSWRPTQKFDLVVASYSLGELPLAERQVVIRSAWESCAGALILVEAGTRRGFAVIAEGRDQLIAMDAAIAAPCPHRSECPMRTAGDWCHFSVRIERTAEHRRLKGGELGYEDEKFSYVVASWVPSEPAKARIVRHPLRYSGHTKLQLCTPAGLQERIVTRSQKELYRAAKRADWGSGWDE